jgi:hypothetical protein
MKKLIATILVLSSISVASAKQQCTGTCIVTQYDYDAEVVVNRSMVATGKDGVEALEQLEWQCFEAGHHAVRFGYQSTREISDLDCIVLPQNKKTKRKK